MKEPEELGWWNFSDTEMIPDGYDMKSISITVHPKESKSFYFSAHDLSPVVVKLCVIRLRAK